MLKVTRIVGAGVTLALLFNGTAMAQMVPSGATDTTATLNQTNAETPAQRNRRIADENGLPPDILTHQEDRYGRPVLRTIEDSIADLGPDGALLAARDDANFCMGLTQLQQLKDQVRIADLEVVRLEQEVAQARTRADREVAEARLGRARNNLFQFLLTGVRVGLVSLIPGVGWAYAGYILTSEVSQYLSREQHNRELRASDSLQDLSLAQSDANTARLIALDYRLQLYDRRGELWDRSMGQWCRVMEPFHTRLLATSATYTPAPASAATAEHH